MVIFVDKILVTTVIPNLTIIQPRIPFFHQFFNEIQRVATAHSKRMTDIRF